MDAAVALRDRVVLVMEPGHDNGAAIAWAAEWAQVNDLGLTVVASYGPFTSPYRGTQIHDQIMETARDRANAWLDRTRHDIKRSHPQISLITALSHRPAWEALIEVSDSARLTVVGTDSLGGAMSSMPSGATDRVVSDAHGPVAFVPPRQQADPRGPILVGVDLAGSSQAATRIAFQVAAASGRTVNAVCAVGSGRIRDGVVTDTEVYAAVEQAIEPFRTMFPTAGSQITVAEGLPEQLLLRMAPEASLLVVGSRGIGGWRGLMIGSVSRRLVTRSRVPVLVARSPLAARR